MNAIWLGFIFKIPERGRQELYALIFPYILSSEQVSLAISFPQVQFDLSRLLGKTIPSFNCPVQFPSRGFRVPAYRLTHAESIPNPSLPAGNIASVIFESEGMKMPPHLKETREIHVQHVVPTKTDFKAFAAYETPLFADSLILGGSQVVGISETPRSAVHDLELRHLIVGTPLDSSYPKIRYILGSMTAVWEGVFRVSNTILVSESSD